MYTFNFLFLRRHVDDIDLYPAAIVEEHLPGAEVGPTFACIIGRQFQRSRSGDRFWHETNDPYIRFTPGTVFIFINVQESTEVLYLY